MKLMLNCIISMKNFFRRLFPSHANCYLLEIKRRVKLLKNCLFHNLTYQEEYNGLYHSRILARFLHLVNLKSYTLTLTKFVL